MIKPKNLVNFSFLLQKCYAVYSAKFKNGTPDQCEQVAMNRVTRMLTIIKSKEFATGEYEIFITQEDWDAIHIFLD